MEIQDDATFRDFFEHVRVPLHVLRHDGAILAANRVELDLLGYRREEYVIRSWNRGAERMFGWTASEAIGRHITLIIPEDRRAEEDEVSPASVAVRWWITSRRSVSPRRGDA